MDKDLSRIREVVKEHPNSKIENLATYLDFNNLNRAHSEGAKGRVSTGNNFGINGP